MRFSEVATVRRLGSKCLGERTWLASTDGTGIGVDETRSCLGESGRTGRPKPGVRGKMSPMNVDTGGYLRTALQVPSPNCDPRPRGEAITLVVVHGISLPPGVFGGDGVERLFTNTLDPDADPYYAAIAHLRVSAHFLVRRDGGVVQFVSCNDRAWHAGVSSWRGRERCNDFSIGIELEGTDDTAYAAPQYRRLAALLRALKRRYPSIASAAGHSDIAPGRKTDPGPAFDWDRLAGLTGARRLGYVV
jgi:AmpD protein